MRTIHVWRKRLLKKVIPNTKERSQEPKTSPAMTPIPIKNETLTPSGKKRLKLIAPMRLFPFYCIVIFHWLSLTSKNAIEKWLC